ncbi:hypothetical protein [Streptosporangium saharense]|uniref:hypothetical protein n=1 Tax=Streptosporangium saharense TaxID=1706840 RepID=UPI0036A682B2
MKAAEAELHNAISLPSRLGRSGLVAIRVPRYLGLAVLARLSAEKSSAIIDPVERSVYFLVLTGQGAD